MSDRDILEKESKKSDELLLYKIGRRNRKQTENFIVRMMKLAREEEHARIKEKVWE